MNTAWAEATGKGWAIGNGRIRLDLEKGAAGGVTLASLRRPSAGGTSAFDWALRGSPVGPMMQWEKTGALMGPEDAGFKLEACIPHALPDEAAELVLSWRDDRRKALLTLRVTCFPGSAVLEWTARRFSRGPQHAHSR